MFNEDILKWRMTEITKKGIQVPVSGQVEMEGGYLKFTSSIPSSATLRKSLGNLGIPAEWILDRALKHSLRATTKCLLVWTGATAQRYVPSPTGVRELRSLITLLVYGAGTQGLRCLVFSGYTPIIVKVTGRNSQHPTWMQIAGDCTASRQVPLSGMDQSPVADVRVWESGYF